MRRIDRSTGVDLALLALITIVGATLRLLWLDQYPIGWHHDEALMGVMAGQVYQDANRPIFFASYLGQEPLYLYLVAGMMAVMSGNMDILPVRLTSALVGLATIPVTYLLGRALFGRRVGLVAAALVSLSFWQVMSSRNGYRSITLPLLTGLAVYLYWRARRSPAWGPALLAGAAIGGSWYTYLAGRAFPLVFAAYGALSLLWNRPTSGRLALRRGLILGIAAVAAVLPLVYFWATNPGTFGARMGQIFFWGAEPSKGGAFVVLGGNIAKLLGIFTIYGEPLWRYNISGRPIFVWALGPAFYLGTAILARRAIRRDPASLMIVAWLAVMTLPCILSEEVGAYTLRAMGMVPAIYLLPAIGLVAAWEWLERRRRAWRVSVPAVAGLALVAVVLAVEAGLTYHDYFDVWAHSFGAAYEDGADIVAASRYLQREARPEREEVIVGSEFLGHPVVAQLAPRVYDSLRWVDGNKAMVYRPEGGRDALYVFPHTTRPWAPERLLPSETEVSRDYYERGIAPGEPAPATYIAYRLSPAAARAQVDRLADEPGTTHLNANVGGQVLALAGQAAPRAVQGSTLPVTALWRILASPGDQDYVFFAHLIDNQHRMWAQYDENGYPVAQWQPGEVLATRLDMPVGKDVPPGRYRIEIGLYDRRAGVRLPLADEGQKGSLIILGSVKVSAAHASAPPRLPYTMDTSLGEHIRLLGFGTDLQPVPGTGAASQLAVTLAWQATGPPQADYTVFVQLLDAEGRLVAQHDAMPQDGLNPTGSWDEGEVVVDNHTLSLPPDLPAGQYRLIAGMYLGETGERLPVAGSDNFVSLTTIDLPGR